MAKVDEVAARVLKEVRHDRFGNAWQDVDRLSEGSSASAAKLVTAFLQASFSGEVPEPNRATRERILQAGREGWNPANIKLFGHLERVTAKLFGNEWTSSEQ